MFLYHGQANGQPFLVNPAHVSRVARGRDRGTGADPARIIFTDGEQVITAEAFDKVCADLIGWDRA